jgi:transformation/transcription domain-associated protein
VVVQGSRNLIIFLCFLQFLKDFLENTVTTQYSISWKRQAFLKFVDVFEDREYPSELKAKIIQFILIPCMAHCFEKGLGDEFVGSPPMPDADSPDNIVSVLLARVRMVVICNY